MIRAGNITLEIIPLIAARNSKDLKIWALEINLLTLLKLFAFQHSFGGASDILYWYIRVR